MTNVYQIPANFESVYRRSYRSILRFCKGLCRSAEDAEDVAQETFVRAYAAIDSFTHDRPIENWLIRIAQNTFLDLKRKQRRRPVTIQEAALADDRGLETFVDPKPIADEVLMNQVSLPILRDAIASLDEESRELVRMAHVEQLPYSEIAEKLGIRVCTVRSRLHRACKRVRKVAQALEHKSDSKLRLATA